MSMNAINIAAKYPLKKPANKYPVNWPVIRKWLKNNPPNAIAGMRFKRARNQKNLNGYWSLYVLAMILVIRNPYFHKFEATLDSLFSK